jgi:hypothetical protein
MKNIYEVLRQKELEIQQLQKDIEALRVAARLLADDGEIEPKTAGTGPQPMRTSVPTAATASPRPAEAGYSASSGAGVRQFP